MFGSRKRKPDPRLCCPVCGRPAVYDHSTRGFTRDGEPWLRVICCLKCPRGHMSTSWYDDAGTAYLKWLDLVGLTRTRLKEHGQ